MYLFYVLDANGKTWLDPVLRPVEQLIYRILRVDPQQEQDWKQYAIAMLIFSLVTMLFTYGTLRLQDHLPWHGYVDALPDKTPMTPALAFNTAASFTTNTNWQNYAGENTMSYFSQMVALASHNFWSAAVGIAIAAALVRAVARDKARTIGNFWVDLVRIQLYLLIPLCIVYGVFLISQGTIMNFHAPVTTTQLDQSGAAPGSPATQTLVLGPVASQIAIKMLGTNGGGYYNANAAFPYENGTPMGNFIQMLSIFSIGGALTYYFGRMVKNQGHGWAVFFAMLVVFLGATCVGWWAEARGNPHFDELGIAHVGNYEGKEVRFGIFNSALFSNITTDASCGAVNCMHDSLTPLGGMMPLMNIELGEIIFGGVGAGLYGMIVFVIIAIFLAGLMVGRTPEYLGKKIDAFDVKAASLALLILAFSILGFTAWAAVSHWGQAALNNAGPHGFSEILYAFSSCAGNNGSAFAGLNGNLADPHYNLTLGVDALLGRFIMILPIMALAGNLAGKKLLPQSIGSFPVSGGTFVVLLVATILVVGALTFLPALALGPVLEHFLMHPGGPLY